jgi:hypothetical protein
MFLCSSPTEQKDKAEVRGASEWRQSRRAYEKNDPSIISPLRTESLHYERDKIEHVDEVGSSSVDLSVLLCLERWA